MCPHGKCSDWTCAQGCNDCAPPLGKSEPDHSEARLEEHQIACPICVNFSAGTPWGCERRDELVLALKTDGPGEKSE
jgi:hypothetical protein